METVEFLSEVSSSVRSRLSLFWFPMILFGTVNLLGAVVAFAFGPTALGLLWLVAGVLGGIATARFYSREENSAGLHRGAGPTFVVLGALAIGVFTIPIILPADPGWILACWVGLCYLGFAFTEREVPVAVAAIVMLLTGLAIRSFAVDHSLEWASAAMGITLIAIGYLSYRQYRSI